MDKMKKRIIFLLCVTLMLVALAIVGSATTYYTDGTTEYFECEIADTYHIDSYIIKNGGFPKVDADGDALTWYLVSTETDSETGHITKTVASVKTRDYITGTTFSAPLTKYNVVSVNFDKGTNKIPAFGEMDGAQSKEILFIYVPDEVTSLPFRFCQLTSVVVCEFGENSQCDTWDGLTFWGAKSLREIFIPAQLTAFPTHNGGAFDGCSRLEKLTFHEDSVMTSIVGWYFEQTAIKEMILPDSITTITARMFQEMKNLEYVKFGRYVNSIENQANDHFSLFHDCKSLQTVVIPGTLLAENIGTNGNKLTYGFSTASPTFVYTGTLEEFQKIQAVFAKYDQNGALTGATAENGRIVIANHCEVYYDNQHDCDNNCETADDCERECGYTAPQSTHNMLEQYICDSFTSIGMCGTMCQNEGCTINNVVREMPPIFTVNEDNGFSTDGKGGISFGGFVVNIESLSEYNRVNSDAQIKFGAVIMNPKYLVNDTFFEDGEVNAEKGFVKADMSNTKYSNIKIDINGISGEAIDVSIIMAIYAYTDESNLEFIQSQTTKCADKKVTKKVNGVDTALYTVTLASITNTPNASIYDLKEYGEEE